ncbi:hypothetical protein DJ030_17965 [bacterium endosymbiont of Escarpia laminata]|nr:MAG: hypothetical protein DJ030_17965 [bacterium endosymbiont of Escarpia laminata]
MTEQVVSRKRLPADIRKSMALAISDIDFDGDLDVIVANRGGLNQLLINDGSGVFADEAEVRGLTGSNPTFGAVLADVDGDGSDDIFFANRGAANRLLINNGLGHFSDESIARLPIESGQSNSAIFSDLDGDGDQDLLVANGAGGLQLLQNGGAGVFTDATAGKLPAYAGFSVKVGIIDVEPDGAPDILAVFGDSTRLFVNDGTGVFSDQTDSLMPVNSDRVFGALTLDLDTDLDQDILLAVPGMQNRLLENETELPRILLTVSPDYIEVGDTVDFGVQVFDEEGIADTTVTVHKPDTSDVTVPLVGDTASYVTDMAGLHSVIVQVEDNGGSSYSRSQSFTVAPIDVTSPGVTIAISTTVPMVGESVGIDVSASDAESGIDSIELTVNGVVIPVDNSGHADYPATALGVHTVSATVTDRAGNAGLSAPEQFDVQPDTEAPTAVAVGVTPNPVALNTLAAISVAASDNVSVDQLSARVTGPDTPPAGVDVSLVLGGDPANRTGNGNYRPMQPGTYTVEVTARDPSGNESTASTTFEAVGIPDSETPVVTLTIVPHSVATGGSIDIHVSASDNIGVTATILEINGSPKVLDGDGNALFTPPAAGTYSVVARALDDWGNEGSATDTLKAVDLADDVTPPTVEIDTPLENAEIVGQVDILGTVTDETLVSYRMEYAPVGGSFTEFASGNVEVLGSLLGTLDTSGFSEGLYEVRLTAQDGNGVTASTSRYFIYIDGIQLGRFTLDYQDLSIPSMGIAINVQRSYDSASDQVGDFGPGWKLSLLDSDLREDAQGNVFVTLPDGRRTAFVFRPRQPSPFFPIFLPEYQAPPGIYDKLETTDCASLVYSGGQWYCDLGGSLFNPENYRITTKEGMVYDINQTRGVTRIEDRSGNTLEIGDAGIVSRDSAGALVKQVVFNRNAEGRITSVVDPLGHAFNYLYDGDGRLVQAVDQQGNETDFTYQGSSHLLDDVMTPGGCFPLKNIYDVDGNLVERQDAAGNSTTYAYDTAASTETVTDARGFATTYYYDRAGQVVRVDDPLSTTTRNEYDENGNKIRVTDPSGKVTSYTYDADGNALTRSFEPESGMPVTFTTEYNTYGQVTRYINPEGDRTDKAYDADGNLVRRELFNAAGVSIGVETFTYDANGNRLSWIDAGGKTTSYTYDAFGNQTTVSDPTGVTTTLEYDANGNRTALIDGLGNRSEFTFNGLNKPTSMTHAGEALPRYLISYTAEAEVETLTDANGDVTTYNYDCMGKMAQVVDAHGQITDFGFDAAGNLSDITLPDGNQVQMDFDGSNRMTGRTGPDGGTWGYGYSPNGLLDSFSYPDASAIAHDLDNMDRMVRRTEPERTVDFILDDNSRITSVTEHTGGTDHVTSYSYDGNGLVTEVTDRNGRRIDYGWNSRGDITGLTSNDGLNTTYTYDDASRVKRVTSGAHWAEYSYDGAGRRSRIDYSNGTAAEYGYDTLGELTGLVIRDGGGSVISSYGYGLDGNNQRIAVTTEDGSISYDYDALYRLIREDVDTASLGTFTNNYAYDAVGNRLDSGATFGADSRLLTHGGAAYTHDANGNVTGRGSESYTYDSSQRLTGYNDGTNTASYAYDYLGRRIERTVNGDTTQYLYHDQDVLAEYDDLGNRLVSYTYAPGMDQLLMMERDGQTWFYHTDGLGSVVAITDVAGNLVQRYGYDAWGNVILSDGPFAFSGSGSQVNTRTYTGREYDAESGLYHYRARAYDPTLGRFLQKDSDQGLRRNPQSLHAYAYALNNPLSFTDPTGRIALVQYAYLLSYPNGREVVAAAIGWLQGYGLTSIAFIGEVIGMSTIYPGDIGAIWAAATESTKAIMEGAKSALDWAGQGAELAGVAGIPGAFAGGVSFEIGIEITLFTGDSLGKASIKAEGGGFSNGVAAGFAYIGSLAPK